MKLCKQTMINSYAWISFSPEKRGEQDFEYYTNLLAADLETLGEHKGNYERKFIQRVMMIYHRQARCASPMIAGPANFPFRSNLKKVDAQRRAEDEFTHWRNRYLRLAKRERVLSPEAEIDKTLAEIDALEIKHKLYKRMNKIKSIEGKKAFAQENEFIHVFDYWANYGHVVPSFHLTNNNNKIKERKKKLEVMKKRIERKTNFERIEINGGYVAIENDRLVIKHDEKPAREIIDLIKANGFKYSPKTVSWVRKHTENALWSLKQILPKLQAV